METTKNIDSSINFDFITYYKTLSNCKNEIEKIRIESRYFNYYDSLEKSMQIEFKKIDKEARISEANQIQKEINIISKSLQN